MNYETTLDLTPYRHRTSVHTYARYQPCPYSESETELYYERGFSPHISRPLPDTAQRLQDERFICRRNLGWNIDWAVAFIVNHLDPANSPNAASTFRRICILAETLSKENCSQDIACHVFNLLDQVLFAGHLKDTVYLKCANLGVEVSGATFTHDRGPNARVKRISVVLNSTLLQHARSRDVVASLIHQMIHAYFLVACGPQNENEVEYGRLAHGMHFGKVMSAIKKLSAANGKPLPLAVEDQRGPHLYCDDRFPLPRALRRRKGKWYCSHCHAHVEAPPDKDVEDWYVRVCKPLLELPDTVQKSTVFIYNDRHHKLEEVSRCIHTTPSSIDSVEFLFKDKPVLVPATELENFPSIRRAFDKTNSRFLLVPEQVDEEIFMLLLQLLHLGRYSPDIGPVCAPGRKGPPIIESLHPDSASYLLTDIRMFQLGAKLGFDEVKAHALERLNSQHVTREDPVQVLQAIYDDGGGADPDAELRAWALQFLLKGPEADWLDDDDATTTTTRGTMAMPPSLDFLPNLLKLARDLGFKTRFRALVQRRSALHIDVLKARERLLRGPRVETCRHVSGLGLGLGLGLGRPPLVATRRPGGYQGVPSWPEDEYERLGGGVRSASGSGRGQCACWDGW